MSEDGITLEEVEALTTADDAPEPSGVRPRDFRQPKRLSSEQLEELRVRVSLGLGDMSAVLKPWFRSSQNLSLQTVSEVSFNSLTEAIEGTVCAMQFRAADSVGWVVWETHAALVATARSMGVEPAGEEEGEPTEKDGEQTPAPERLSSVEAAIACRVLGDMLNALGQTLGFQAGDFKLLQSHEELDHSIVELRGTDTQRLRIDLELDGPGEPNALKFYLPGVVPSSDEADKQQQAQPSLVPEHLSKVMLEVRAAFDEVELPLDELRALEVGDVISLSTRVSAPINLTIEDLGCAKVHLGKKDGQLAVQLESLTLHSAPNQ